MTDDCINFGGTSRHNRCSLLLRFAAACTDRLPTKGQPGYGDGRLHCFFLLRLFFFGTSQALDGTTPHDTIRQRSNGKAGLDKGSFGWPGLMRRPVLGEGDTFVSGMALRCCILLTDESSACFPTTVMVEIPHEAHMD